MKSNTGRARQSWPTCCVATVGPIGAAPRPSFLEQVGFIERAWVAGAPAAAVDLCEELTSDSVEQIDLLEVDGMAGRGKNRQPRRGTDPLDEKRWIDTVVVLVARDHVQRHPQRAKLALKTVNRRPLHLHAVQRVGRAERRVLGELLAKLAKAAGVLVLQLHTRWANLVRLDRLRSAELDETRVHLRVVPIELV